MTASNFPPGVSDAPYQKGVYKYSCEDHATSYGHGYMELGTFYLEDDALVLCDEAQMGEWVKVYAAECKKHGRWSEDNVYHSGIRLSDANETVWLCPRGHLFITEDCW